MKYIYIHCRYRRQSRGMILVLMLVLAALTSLLAASNLERIQQRALLDSALAMRMQSDELLFHALQQGVAYAKDRLRIEDFDASQRGVYRIVAPDRFKSDYRRIARPASSPISGANAGYWIELFSEGATIQTAQGRFYLRSRLLINAYAESPSLSLGFSQALVETALPTLRAPTSGTEVVKVASLPETKIIATRVFK